MPEDVQYDGSKHVACIEETNKNLLWLAVCGFKLLLSSHVSMLV